LFSLGGVCVTAVSVLVWVQWVSGVIMIHQQKLVHLVLSMYQ